MIRTRRFKVRRNTFNERYLGRHYMLWDVWAFIESLGALDGDTLIVGPRATRTSQPLVFHKTTSPNGWTIYKTPQGHSLLFCTPAFKRALGGIPKTLHVRVQKAPKKALA